LKSIHMILLVLTIALAACAKEPKEVSSPTPKKEVVRNETEPDNSQEDEENINLHQVIDLDGNGSEEEITVKGRITDGPILFTVSEINGNGVEYQESNDGNAAVFIEDLDHDGLYEIIYNTGFRGMFRIDIFHYKEGEFLETFQGLEGKILTINSGIIATEFPDGEIVYSELLSETSEGLADEKGEEDPISDESNETASSIDTINEQIEDTEITEEEEEEPAKMPKDENVLLYEETIRPILGELDTAVNDFSSAEVSDYEFNEESFEYYTGVIIGLQSSKLKVYYMNVGTGYTGEMEAPAIYSDMNQDLEDALEYYRKAYEVLLALSMYRESLDDYSQQKLIKDMDRYLGLAEFNHENVLEALNENAFEW
jgi:hypothetical protein